MLTISKKLGLGKLVILLPYIKCKGASVWLTPSTSSCMYVSGLELITPLISTNNVLNSSNSRLVRPIAFLRLLFVTWIILSQKPLHQGAFSTMNFHVIWLLAKNRLTSSAHAILTTSLLEDLKVLALSEITVAGSPLLLVNRQNANKYCLHPDPWLIPDVPP